MWQKCNTNAVLIHIYSFIDKHILRIKNSVSNLVDILNDFLSVSKLEEGMISAHPETFNVNQLLEDIAYEMSALIDKGQTIKLNFEGVTKMNSDPKLIRNVMVNLLTNAVKYSFENSVIVCGTRLYQNGTEIYVQNDGIGIPEKEQKNLFQRFFRAENATNIKGTGLGLNIVQKYVSLLGGAIEFESTANQTTIFKVKIPHQVS